MPSQARDETMLRTAALAAVLLIVSARADEPLTVAEKSDYKATSRHDEVLAFCEALAAKSPVVRFTDMGTSGDGKKLPLLIIADPPVSTPAEAKASGKLVAYVQANIHAGEVDGKEGLLMLAREISLASDRPLLKDLILLFCPDFNPDGNDKIDPNNRRSQNGPVGVGLRANAGGFDLNRDFVKLETPEVRAFVHIMNAWDPALVIDCHTTNGSYHRYTLTYDGPRHPNTGLALVESVRDKMLPEVNRMLEQKTGYKSFVYGNFSRDRSKWETYGQTPRYSTQYVGMRGRIGILSESYSYAPYKDRIIASREFVRAWLEYLAAHKNEIRKLLADNDQGNEIAVRTNSVALRKTVALGYEEETKDGRRAPILDKPRDYELDVVTRVEPTEKVEKPYAYLFPPSYKAAVATLVRHGITVEELKEDAAVPAEAAMVTKIDKAARPFQKHTEVSVEVAVPTAVAKAGTKPRVLPAGTIVVRTAQPLGVFASYLLEPRSEDGLTTWNFFDEGMAVDQEFPVLRLRSAAPLKLGTVQLPAENDRNSQ
jgi:dipeptidyl-peptidase 4